MNMQKTAAAGQSWDDTRKDYEDVKTAQKSMQTITFSLGNFNDENRTFQAIASTPIIDRMGDSVQQSGWDFTWFLKNPIIPWAHDYNQPPVGRVIEIGVNDQGYLQFTYQAPPLGVYDFADTIWNLYRNQFMFAFSVGFIPKDYEGNYSDGYTFTEAELLEISAVVVPANPQAVVLAYKMGVVDEKGMRDLKSKMSNTLKNIDSALEKEKSMSKKETKGAVADELAAEELWEQKWQKVDGLYDVFWAFLDVWFSEDTALEDYDGLVKELADLIAQTAGADAKTASAVADAVKNVDEAKVKALKELLSGKSLTNGQEVSDTKDMSKTKALSTDDHERLADIHEKMTECMEQLKDFIGKPGIEGDAEGEAEEKAVTEVQTKDVNEEAAVAEEAEVKSESEVEADGAEQEKSEEQVEEVEPEAEAEEEAEPVVETEEAEAEAEPKAEVEAPAEEQKGLTDEDLVDPDDLTDEQAEEIIKAVNEALAAEDKE